MQKVLFILGQLNDDDVEWLARVGFEDRSGLEQTIGVLLALLFALACRLKGLFLPLKPLLRRNRPPVEPPPLAH